LLKFLGKNQDENIAPQNPIGGPIFTGKSWIEDDTICDQYEMLFDGIKVCADTPTYLTETFLKKDLRLKDPHTTYGMLV